jgi:hypothetical protein
MFRVVTQYPDALRREPIQMLATQSVGTLRSKAEPWNEWKCAMTND